MGLMGLIGCDKRVGQRREQRGGGEADGKTGGPGFRGLINRTTEHPDADCRHPDVLLRDFLENPIKIGNPYCVLRIGCYYINILTYYVNYSLKMWEQHAGPGRSGRRNARKGEEIV